MARLEKVRLAEDMMSETVDSRTIKMKRKQYDTTGPRPWEQEKRDGQTDRQTDTPDPKNRKST